ncbi:MAG: biotin--[acetyl-CoA-carboxylase] ligase [Bacteroidota bacterium]|nr:biotin--[acetyl-CoA-carboxylase] ligase [Bacteroidota bacterium]
MEKNFVIKWLDEIDSTNSEALRHIGELDNLSVIAARNQTAGRGQRGNKWVVEPGANLTFSIVLKFAPGQLKVRDCFCITEAAALAVAGIREAETRIKWPNDIYVRDRKLCGMLIENGSAGDSITYSVVGIGLNVNQTSFDPSLTNPTSLKKLTGKDFDTEAILSEILDNLGSLLPMLETEDGRASLHQTYNGDVLYRKGVKGRYRDNLRDVEFEGIIKGVAENGRLSILNCTEAVEASYAFKELSFFI